MTPQTVSRMPILPTFWPIGVFFMLQMASGTALANEIDDLVPIIVQTESSGDPGALGDQGKARGLMQIQETTWVRLSEWPWSDAFDPEKNLMVGRKRLEEISEKWNTTDPAVLAWHWNCGDNSKLTFDRWKKTQKNKTYRSLYQ